MDDTADADIRLLTPADLDSACTLSTTAGWNQRMEDWRLLLDIAPAGSFAALHGSRVVGTAIGIDYGAFGWIAMMLVDPAYRGRGLGARLLEAAMAVLPPDQPVRLDATPLGRPLYQRYGFEHETTLSRRVAEPGRRAIGPTAVGEVRPLTPGDLDVIAEQDAHVFGGSRRAVLEWALDRAPQYACGARDASGRMHYCFGRAGRLFDQIGPIVAGSDDLAAALASAAMRTGGDRAMVIDAFDARTAFTSWLERHGFAVQRPLYRMARAGRGRPLPEPGVSGSPLVEFGILGPEFG